MGNQKVLLTPMQLGCFKFPFRKLSSSLVSAQNKGIKTKLSKESKHFQNKILILIQGTMCKTNLSYIKKITT